MRAETISAPAQVERLDTVLAFVRGLMDKEGFAGDDIMQTELAAEEAFVNICLYSGLSPQEEITVEAACSPERIRVAFTDHGKRFNPLLVGEADTSSPAPEREIGGLGVHMIRNLTDQVEYEYIDGANRLSFVKLRKSKQNERSARR